MYPQILSDISQCVSTIFPVPCNVGAILVHESSSHTPSRHGFLVVTLSSGITGGRTNDAFKDTETDLSSCVCYSHCSGNEYFQDNVFEDIIWSALSDREQSCTCRADACKPAVGSVHVLPDVHGFVFSMTRHGATLELTEMLQSHKAWQAPG